MWHWNLQVLTTICDLDVLDHITHLTLLKQVGTINHIPKDSIPAVQQVCSCRRQLRLLHHGQTTLILEFGRLLLERTNLCLGRHLACKMVGKKHSVASDVLYTRMGSVTPTPKTFQDIESMGHMTSHSCFESMQIQKDRPCMSKVSNSN